LRNRVAYKELQLHLCRKLKLFYFRSSSMTDAVANSRLLEALIIRSLRQHGARIRRDDGGNLCLGRFDIAGMAETLRRNVDVKAD
jgi:hypothetical protein